MPPNSSYSYAHIPLLEKERYTISTKSSYEVFSLSPEFQGIPTGARWKMEVGGGRERNKVPLST